MSDGREGFNRDGVAVHRSPLVKGCYATSFDGAAGAPSGIQGQALARRRTRL